MRILFVTSEFPSTSSSGLGTFAREYVRELKKYADVRCIYFHLRNSVPPLPDGIVDHVFVPNLVFEVFSPDARILETAASLRSQLDFLIKDFAPDIIHCNDRQTYMPFRFDKNVFFSSHLIFTDLIGHNVMNDLYFQEVKVERCAFENSAVLAVYSDFAAKKANKLTGGLCNPLVLPLGLRVENFLKTGGGKIVPFAATQKNGLLIASERKLFLPSKKEKIRISYFGRLETVQKGVNEFIQAVNILGQDFKEKYSVEYSLYGSGKLMAGLDLSLFDNMSFLEGEALYEAYKTSDIVVMPSRYEPFGLTGLEAMASGALLLLPRGLGMDMYAEPDYNCLEIPHSAEGIASVMERAVTHFEDFKLLRDNAVRTAMKWTWKRSVLSHLFVYRQMMKGRFSQLWSAYREEERKMLKDYSDTSDVEKLASADAERRVLEKALCRILGEPGFSGRKKYCEGKEVLCENAENPSSLTLDCLDERALDSLEESGKRVLILTGVYQCEKNALSPNIEIFSVLNECELGFTVRPECLPFDDGEFDYVLVCGAWESVIEPFGAIVEMERVCKKELTILFYTGFPKSWQSFQVENLDDWKKLTGKQWPLVSVDWISEEGEYPYKSVKFLHKKTSQKGMKKKLSGTQDDNGFGKCFPA